MNVISIILFVGAIGLSISVYFLLSKRIDKINLNIKKVIDDEQKTWDEK